MVIDVNMPDGIGKQAADLRQSLAPVLHSIPKGILCAIWELGGSVEITSGESKGGEYKQKSSPFQPTPVR